MKELALEFLRVTQSAALAASPWIGRGKKIEADDAATTAMRDILRQLPMDAIVVIGEGELDDTPMLHIGERLGTGTGPALDIAVDPLEGTNLLATGQENSAAVIAAAPRGCLLHAPDMYMQKIAVGPAAAGSIDIDAPLRDNISRVAKALGKPIGDVTVVVQSRDRHRVFIEEIQSIGARIKLFGDGDVMCAIATAIENSGIDIFVGIGGAPEGVISAVALRCLGGDMQARLLPSSWEEEQRCISMGIADPRQPMSIDQLVASDECIFAATGITTGMLLQGVTTESLTRWVTHSLLSYGNSGTFHFIRSVHQKQLGG